jgi:hypothetical protein
MKNSNNNKNYFVLALVIIIIIIIGLLKSLSFFTNKVLPFLTIVFLVFSVLYILDYFFNTESLNDSCSGVECGEHGNCSNGKCICIHGYTGNNCQKAPST